MIVSDGRTDGEKERAGITDRREESNLGFGATVDLLNSRDRLNLVVGQQPSGEPVQDFRRYAPLSVALALLNELPVIKIKIIGDGQLDRIVPEAPSFMSTILLLTKTPVSMKGRSWASTRP